MAESGRIRTGIGGWTFAAWRGSFYPQGLVQRRELEYAASQLGTIEVNGTFYRTQKPAVFAQWAQTVPDGFVFSLKAPRYVVNRRDLAAAGDGIARFVDSGIAELGDRLGPILWQLPASKRFDEEEFAAFLALLPAAVDGRPLRHAVELRHPSFACAEAVALCRQAGAAIVYGDCPDYPQIADVTADFVYARLQQGDDACPTGYPEAAIERWAERADDWAAGGGPRDLHAVDDEPAPERPRDVFVYFIREGKARAPQAAMALATAGRERRR